jgi:hypothetical protein
MQQRHSEEVDVLQGLQSSRAKPTRKKVYVHCLICYWEPLMTQIVSVVIVSPLVFCAFHQSCETEFTLSRSLDMPCPPNHGMAKYFSADTISTN